MKGGFRIFTGFKKQISKGVSMKGIKLLNLCLVAVFIMSCENPTSSDVIVAQSVDVGTTYSNLTIADYDIEFFQFVAEGNGSHTITISNLGSDLGWLLFTNPSYTNPNEIAYADDHIDTTSESDSTPSLVAGTTYYIEVDEYGGVDSHFDLLITYP